MARSLNKASLIGNVGSDPDIRTVGTGAKVANFSLATTRRWNDRNGQQQEKTEWHRIVAWDKGFNLAEVVEKYVKKGERLFVEGDIEYRTYEDKDGNTRYITEIRAREIILLSGRSDGEHVRERVPVGAGAKSSDYDDFQAGGPDEDDDLPF
jgi:single-strand DNA-binding protein